MREIFYDIISQGRVPTGYLIMTVQSSLEELCNIYDSVGRLPATTGKAVRKPSFLKLGKEQREILVGLLFLTGKLRHLHDQHNEWLHPSCKPGDDSNTGEIPSRFYTVSHSYFEFDVAVISASCMPVHVWGHRTSSRDIMVKLIRRGVRRVIKTLKSKSLDRRVKNKGESVLDSVNGAPAFQALVGCAIQRPIFLIKPCSLQLSQSKSCDELQALQSQQFTTFHARILMESVIRARTRHSDWTQERIKDQVFSSSCFLVSSL
ncbi:LOW QUALITY PROTEIN: hypothetical protein NC652_011480 [Populus alba x Populus x berolinensis]|nr:LOW QUALITY PROTEIN: hypothetical protein NC652_011480 [Populus alba x Populus x berolinensis]